MFKNHEKNEASLLELFEAITDPRIDRTKRHTLSDILMLTLIATLCGADNCVLIEEFGKSNRTWLNQYLSLLNGIPSHDTIGRVFAALNPKEFERFFIKWVSAVSSLTEGELINIDGKTLRGSHDKYQGKEALHLVQAWANSNSLVIGQLRSEGKKNEIKTIPKLLELLAIEGCIITIDAMGCQKAIADKIIEEKADYILAVKDNQPTLSKEVETSFTLTQLHSQDTQVGKEHGRIETRTCSVIQNLRWIGQSQEWTALKSVVKIESIRQEIATGKKTEQTRFYISSLERTAEYFNKAIRAHWGIENSLHYVLDVAFSEDQSRIRMGNADQNMAIIRKITLNLLKNDTSVKLGIRNKRFKAGWDREYLLRILKI